MRRPIGYFVHHQGRGHAERAAAIGNALPPDQPITLFTANAGIFPPLPPHAEVVTIPSLFEASDDVAIAPLLASMRTPSNLHCAPLGWVTITQAVATLTRWFVEAGPSLFISDVSAELAQLARIASIPCIPVVQHGDRSDPGHMSAYEGSVGILAPYSPLLEQPGRPEWMRNKTHYAAGVGIDAKLPDRVAARSALDLPPDREIILVVAGGGGTGTPATPLTIGARAEPDTLWVTIGSVEHEWHATAPGNLRHLGWVDNATTWIAAADRIVSSAGNTTVHQVAATGRPWIVVPEWRYFDEQVWKARMLEQAGAAAVLDHWPSHVGAWHDAWALAGALSPAKRQSLVDPNAAAGAAAWLMALADSLWMPPALTLAVPPLSLKDCA